MLPNLEALEAELSDLQLEPSQEELARLEIILEKLSTAENAVIRARRAGIEVSDIENRLQNTRTSIQRILREYKQG